MKSEKWTKEEDNKLIEYYTLYGIDYCINNFNRTKRAIQLRRKKLNISTKNNIKLKYHKEELEIVVKNSFTYKECLSKLEINNYGSSYNTLKKYIKMYNLNITHFKNDINNIINNKIDLKDILVENSTFNRTHLKERLYKDGLKERKCELCGQGEEWYGNHMSLILDHINGVNNDNRIENIRIVCPNCNATLDTHCRGNNRLKIINEQKNRKQRSYINKKQLDKKTDNQINYILKSRKVERPPLDQLLMEVKELGYRGTGKKYGVSDVSIRKWIKCYNKNNF